MDAGEVCTSGLTRHRLIGQRRVELAAGEAVRVTEDQQTHAMERARRRRAPTRDPFSRAALTGTALAAGCLLLLLALLHSAPATSALGPEQGEQQPAGKTDAPPAEGAHYTQPSEQRQVDTPSSRAPAPATAASPPRRKPDAARSVKQRKQTGAAAESQDNYDKYQLKGGNSHAVAEQPADEPSSAKAGEPHSAPADEPAPGADGSVGTARKSPANASGHQSAASKAGAGKSPIQQSLLKRLLPGAFKSVAGSPAEAASGQPQHQRSAPSGPPHGLADGVLSKASNKIAGLLAGGHKKSGPAGFGLVPNRAPFFSRKPSIDRQSGFASGLLSNPLGLGLLFSAPLIPSLLLTPLAIAGLSPAMSAINNFFGDDDDSAAASSTASPLGSGSALSSLLQASGAAGGSSPNLALQAVHSLIGPPSSTERPLFNPGMFASRAVQTASAPLAAAAASSSSASSGGAGSLPVRGLLGGGSLIQTAASMISPSFAAPPSGGASAATDADSDDKGLIQMASEVFDKVANYMGSERDAGIAQASSAGSAGSAEKPSALASLAASLSPFSFLSGSASGGSSAAAAAVAASSPTGSSQLQRAGFFSILKNVYELFSSSFLRRQEVGDSNECQQRLICELHQRAMNSKLFKRTIQSNLLELAQLERSLQEQLKLAEATGSQAADTKAVLSDFLRASNNFRSGRELINCSQMFPKCPRSMLLSAAAGAHLAMDPALLGNAGGLKGIGKLSSLMKKMKFKSSQEKKQLRKLRKASKQQPATSVPLNQLPRALPSFGEATPLDYLASQSMYPKQQQQQQQQQPPQPAPDANLKLFQQLLAMSQTIQQQQQPVFGAGNQAPRQQVYQPSGSFGAPLQVSPVPGSVAQLAQAASQAPAAFYLDQSVLFNSPTESPYFAMSLAPAQSAPADVHPMMSQQQQQVQQVQQTQQQQQPIMAEQSQPLMSGISSNGEKKVLGGGGQVSSFAAGKPMAGAA